MHDSDQLFNRKEAAAYIKYSYNTLAVWDSSKRYDLQPIKIGRSIRYRRSSLDAFLEKHRLSAF